MAAIAQRDQENRTVEVNREKLLTTLKKNREVHVHDYEKAKAGYKSVLLERVNDAFSEAQKILEKRYEAMKVRVADLTEADIEKQRDTMYLVDSVQIEMKVPRSFVKEYDAAIAMATWDVRETLELTYAEFTCFVRDEWDWKSGFDAVSIMYAKAVR